MHCLKGHKESSHQQEGDDENWNQSHHHSCIRKYCWKEQTEGRTHEGAELQSQEGFEEDLGCVGKVAGEVCDGQKEEEGEYLYRQDSCSSTHVVSWGGVGVAESLANEDRSFKIEYVNAGKDIAETCVHDEEENTSLVVLN